MLSGEQDQLSTWAEVDIASILAGDLTESRPEIMRRTDGVPLLYRGKVSNIHGEPEGGKGWAACAAAADALQRGEHVVYVDFEDSAKGVVGRMLALGIERGILLERFHYVAAEERLTKETLPDLESVLACHPALVVLDGITQALSNQGLKSTDNDEIARFFAILPRRIARDYGAAVLMVDHVVKSREERGRWAIGAQQKLAAIDGASFSVEVVRPFGRGKTGHVRIKVGKDRPGYVREHAVGNGHLQTIAEMTLHSDAETGAVCVFLTPPAASTTSDDGLRRYPMLMERISTYLEPGTVPNRRENVAAGVSGKKVHLLHALDTLVSEQYVEEIREGQARAYRSLRPFRQDGHVPVRSRNVPADDLEWWA